MRPVFGWGTAKWAQRALPLLKASLIRRWDKIMYQLENRQTPMSHASKAAADTH
jgi:hypothetical protein